MAKASKERKTMKVSKSKKKAKDEAETIQPAGPTALGHDGQDTQRKDEDDTRVMGEVEEHSQNHAAPSEQKSDAESIERRMSSMDSGENDYADVTNNNSLVQDKMQQDNIQQNNLDQNNLRKDADTYNDEDQAEGEDYDEDEEPHRESR